MTDLLTSIPAEYRLWLYNIYWVAVLTHGGVVVGYGAAEAEIPTPVIIVGAVLLYAGSALGLTAASNTPTPGGAHREE